MPGAGRAAAAPAGPPGRPVPDADLPGPCVEPHGLARFADASPDLIYSADVILDAFPDAQLVQLIRDGRDAVADMLADERCLAWFKPGLANLDTVFPNPFFGVEDHTERDRWPRAAAAVKCALRWRGSVRLSARLRLQVPEDQLFTVRYEELVAKPRRVAADLAEYLDAPLSKTALTGLVRTGARDAADPGVGSWRERLTPRQAAQVEKVAAPSCAARLPARLRRLSAVTGAERLGLPLLLLAAAGELRAVQLGVQAALQQQLLMPPRSATRPSSITRIWSASRIVDSRCAITRDVRPASAVRSARWTAARTRSPGARSPRRGRPPRAP